MINFKNVTLEDKAWVSKLLASRKETSCEYCFGNIFTYGAFHCGEVALVEGNLVFRYRYPEKDYYAFPCGEADISKTLRILVEHIKNEGKTADLYACSNNDIKLFYSIFGDEFEFVCNRDNADYCYNSTDLISLSGKKYRPKRNHISFFKKNFDWSYESISSENKADCIKMALEWIEANQNENIDDYKREFLVIKKAIENFERLGYKGGLIRVDGKVVAFTLGEKLDDNHFCVHFEKAFASFRGAYPIINRQFVENELSEFEYINREDDLGLENLRKAKLSYHPAYLREKHSIRIVK